MEGFNFANVSDNDQSLLAGGNGQFGLNQNCHLVKLEYNPNGGKDGTPTEAIDVTIEIDGKEYNMRMFVPNGTLKSGNKDVNPGDPEYAKAYNNAMTQIVAVVKHIMKAIGIDETVINNNSHANSISEWMRKMQNLIPATFNTIPLDVFLEYQWNIKEGQTKTYPTLPTNMKGGRFVCAHMNPVGSWKPVIESDGSLHYEDNNKNVHQFMRTASFMNSNKGKQQVVEEVTTGATFMYPETAAPQTETPNPFEETSW